MKILKIVFISLLLVSAAFPTENNVFAAGMAQNDFRYGSKGLKQDTFTLYMPIVYKVLAGVSGSVYKSNDFDKIHAARIPLTYTGESNIMEVVPFMFSHKLGMTAYGGKLRLSTAFGKKEDALNISLIGGYATIKGKTDGSGIQKFQQSALGIEAEKTVYKQFTFSAGFAGFLKPSEEMDNYKLAQSIFDMKEIIDFNGYEFLSVLPEWIASFKFTRNFQPEFNSAMYVGYSKVSLRNFKSANSYIAGFQFFVNEDTTLDVGYNVFKYHETSANQYFKILVSTMF